MPDDPRSYQNPSKKAELLAESREYGKKASEAEALRPSSASRWEVLGGTTGDIESALIRDTVTGRTRGYRVGDFLPDGSGVQEVRRGGMGTMLVSLIDEGGREGWVGAPPPAPIKISALEAYTDAEAFELSSEMRAELSEVAADVSRKGSKDTYGSPEYRAAEKRISAEFLAETGRDYLLTRERGPPEGVATIPAPAAIPPSLQDWLTPYEEVLEEVELRQPYKLRRISPIEPLSEEYDEEQEDR